MELLGEPRAELHNETQDKASTLVLQNFKNTKDLVSSLHTSGEYLGCQIIIIFLQV